MGPAKVTNFLVFKQILGVFIAAPVFDWSPSDVCIQVQTSYKEEVFYDDGDETLAQVAKRGGIWPMPGNTQSQVGIGSEQPDLFKDVPTHCRGVGLDSL